MSDGRETIFTRDPADADVWLPTDHALGPWGDTLHGGASTSLIAHHVEIRHGKDRLPGRITFDLIRPVPSAPLTVRSRVLRDGRRIRLVEAELVANGHVCVHAIASFTDRAPLPPGTDLRAVPASDDPTEDELALADTFVRRPDARRAADGPTRGRGLHTRLRVRPISGIEGEGIGRGWVHLPLDLAPGIPLSPLAQLCALADFTNGIAQRRIVTEGGSTGFINADVSLHVLRLPAPGPLQIDAHTEVSADGRGVVSATFRDALGLVARVVETSLAMPSPGTS